MERADFLVIGGGVVGVCLARELKRRSPQAAVSLLEKEPATGAHASGRNSGVLHAGFYYTADSLKARFCRVGNQKWREYCRERHLKVNACGKLVVARSQDDWPALDELLRRAKANGVRLESVDEKAAHEIEPRAKTAGRALFSPDTASVDPSACMAALTEDAVKDGVKIFTGSPYLGRNDDVVHTGAGDFSAGFIINAAGLHADRVANDFGFSQNHRILPFKGLYLYSDEPPGSLRTNVYPVPDLRNPFLGVHFTVTEAGKVKIGPTALPALWRENYEGLENFSASEFVEIAWRELGLFALSGFDFRRLAIEEMSKASRGKLAELASALVTGVKPENYRRWGKPGLRAQLVETSTRKLEMDFVLEGDSKSLHVLNAVSPGFTCAPAFAEHLADRIMEAKR